MVDKVQVEIIAKIDDLNAKVDQVNKKLGSISESGEKVVAGARNIANALLAAFTIKGIESYISAVTRAAQETTRMASIFGVSTEQVGRLGFLATATGGNFQSLAGSLANLQLQLAQATREGSRSRDALSSIGLSAKELIGIPLVDQVLKLSDKFSQWADGTNKVAIAQALVRGGAEQLLPILNLGRERIAALIAAYQRTGAELSGPMAAAFTETRLKIEIMSASFGGLANRIFAVLKPAIDAAIDYVTRFIQSIDAETIKRAATAIVNTIATMASAVVSFFSVMIESADRFIQKMKFALQGAAAGALIGILGGPVGVGGGALIGSALGLALESLINALREETPKLDAEGNKLKSSADKILDTIEDFRKRLLAGIGNLPGAPGGADKPSAPMLRVIDPKDIQAQIAALDTLIRIEQMGMQRKMMILDSEANAHRFTNAEKTALALQYTEAAYQAELALLNKKLLIGGLDKAQRQTILDQIKILTEQHTTDVLRIQLDAVAKVKAQWMDFFSSLQSSISSSFMGLLGKTMTWAQAFRNIFQSAFQWVTNWILKLGFEWAAGELARTAATTAGVAARTAAEQTGAAASFALFIGQIIKSIMASAVAVFGGIFAFLAPFMGPAAAGPALAGQAAVVAAAGAVGGVGFEQGAWEIPRNMRAMIHAGEMVVPAPFAQELRENGGLGGGGGLTVHLNAIDARSGADYLDRMMPSLARKYAAHVKDNPGDRPKT